MSKAMVPHNKVWNGTCNISLVGDGWSISGIIVGPSSPESAICNMFTTVVTDVTAVFAKVHLQVIIHESSNRDKAYCSIRDKKCVLQCEVSAFATVEIDGAFTNCRD